jgi:hypothetical protein
MDKKRIIYIVIFSIISILLGYLLYRIFFATPNSPTTTKPNKTTSTTTGGQQQFPQSGQGNQTGNITEPGTLPNAPGRQQGQTSNLPEPLVQTVIKDPVVGARVSQNGSLNYYNQLDGKFYRIGSDGKPQLLSDTVFYNVQKVTWSPTKNASILEYPDGSKIFYDFDTKKQATLPKYWEQFSFATQGDKIAAKSLGFSPENRWLVTANPDGSNTSLIAALGDNADKVTVNWSPNQQIVGTSLTGQSLGGDRQEVLFVGLHGENFKSTIVEGRDLRSLWSTDGKKLLYSVYSAQNNYKPGLWVVNAEGDAIGSGRKFLNISTWADKCSFSNPKTVFCGVPVTLDSGAGFAPSLANTTPDSLVKIDVETGAQTIIPMPEDHIIDTINVSPDGQKLFFTDKQKAGIFSVNL